MNDAGQEPTTEIKPRDLEKLLDASQAILGRVSKIQGRLGEMDVRLHGETPETATGGSATSVDGGILGQFQGVHAETERRCECIDDWLSRIESAV